MSQLSMILDNSAARHEALVTALRGHLLSLARKNGRVTSDDACSYMEAHGIGTDKRIIGAVLRAPAFVNIGYERSSRRRGTHSIWSAA